MAYLKNVVLLSLSLPLLTSAWHHPGSRHDRWPQQPEDAPITSTIEVFLPDETPTISVPSTSPLAEEIPLDKSTTLAQASSVPQPISAAVSGGYKKLATYDASNWFTSFDYQDVCYAAHNEQSGLLTVLSRALTQPRGRLTIFLWTKPKALASRRLSVTRSLWAWTILL